MGVTGFTLQGILDMLECGNLGLFGYKCSCEAPEVGHEGLAQCLMQLAFQSILVVLGWAERMVLCKPLKFLYKNMSVYLIDFALAGVVVETNEFNSIKSGVHSCFTTSAILTPPSPPHPSCSCCWCSVQGLGAWKLDCAFKKTKSYFTLFLISSICLSFFDLTFTSLPLFLFLSLGTMDKWN